MKTIKMFCIYMGIALILALVGVHIVNKPDVAQWMESTPRTAMLYDAYERYDSEGRPSWKGIFKDAATGHRFEYNIEPRQYREFVSTNQTKEYIVTASKDTLKIPGGPFGTTFGPFLMITGFFMGLFAIARSFVMYSDDKYWG